MEKTLRHETRLINIAGSLGTVFGRLAMAEIFLLFVTKCLGIPKETWAIVAAIVPFTSAFQILSSFLTERVRRRKLISLGCFAVSRLAVPFFMLLPFFTRPDDIHTRILMLAAVVLSYNAVSNIASTAWLSWVADIVPQAERGRFYSSRSLLTTISDICILLIAGPLLDIACTWKLIPGADLYSNPWGYIIVFTLAFILGELDLVIHSRVPDRRMAERPRENRMPFVPLLIETWRHRGFRSLMAFRLLFAIGESIGGPFAVMYLFDELGLSATAVTAITAGFLTTNALTFGVWRRIGDRYGYRTVCQYSTFFVALGLFYWWLIPQHHPMIRLPLVHNVDATILIIAAGYILHGTVWSGFGLSINTLIMNIAPPRHRSVYFAQITAMLGIVWGISILLGRLIYVWTQPLWADGLYFLDTKITGIHFLYGIAFCTRMLSIPFLRSVPDARAELAQPQLGDLLRMSPLRLLPALFTIAPDPDDEQPPPPAPAVPVLKALPPDLRASLQVILDRSAHENDEFQNIIRQEALARGDGIARILDELPHLAATPVQSVRARAAARRIRRLYMADDRAACLRTLRRLSNRIDRRTHSALADAARTLIDRLADSPAADSSAPVIALYAYLQLAREPETSVDQPPGDVTPSA